MAKKALAKGIILIPGQLTGRKPFSDKMSYYNSFKIDEEKDVITECANGNKPIYTEKNDDTNTYYALFEKEDCHNCPYQEECRIVQNTKMLIQFPLQKSVSNRQVKRTNGN